MLLVLRKTHRDTFIPRSVDIYHWWVSYGNLSQFNSSLLLRRDEGIIPIYQSPFCSQPSFWCTCYASNSSTPLRQLIHQKGVDNLELSSRRNERVWSQEERRESHHVMGTGERAAGKIRPSEWLRSGWNHNIKHFFSTHMFPCVAYKGINEQFLHFFTLLYVYPDKVVPFWARL